MKPSYLACTLLVSAVTGGIGYWARGQLEESGTFLAAKSLPQLDYFIVPESFSRAENAKKQFDGLCTRVRLEIESRLTDLRRIRSDPGASKAEVEIQFNRIIRDLDDGIAEFEGTGQELYLTEDLFYALKRGERYDRWVNVYLDALYRHPMHPVVAQFSGQAVSVSLLAGREAEVVSGLGWVSRIPLDFAGKNRIKAALIAAEKSTHMTRTDGSGEAVSQLLGTPSKLID